RSAGLSVSYCNSNDKAFPDCLREPVDLLIVAGCDGTVAKLIRDRRAHGPLANDMVWAIDPIDGTANFVNGYPLFAASIGVLYGGGPLAGALWCAASHALRSGVYPARSGVPLSFDDQLIEPKSNLAVRRWLAGVPNAGAGRFPWDIRVSGSA